MHSTKHIQNTNSEEFELTEKDYAYLRNLAFKQAGISLNEHKRMLVYNRLVKRLRVLKLASFKSYCKILKTDPQELIIFLNAITTNTTSWFRANHQFEYFKNIFLPQWLENKKSTSVLRVWSAGCSTGEEAYSIAIAACEAMSLKQQQIDIQILATDINEEALAAAQKGIYEYKDIDELEIERKKRWFLKGSQGMVGYVRVKPELRQLVTFKPLNLMESWPSMSSFDIIFCRNVAIYFDKDTQKKVFEKFADLLEPQGILVIGHSESLYNISRRFKHLGNNIYKRIL